MLFFPVDLTDRFDVTEYREIFETSTMENIRFQAFQWRHVLRKFTSFVMRYFCLWFESTN